jgi:hypothetical protein
MVRGFAKDAIAFGYPDVAEDLLLARGAAEIPAGRDAGPLDSTDCAIAAALAKA